MQILPGEIPLSVIEKYLTLCQKIQWVASQMSFSFGLLYYVFRFATDVGVNPLLMVHVSGPFQGIGFFNGLFSMLVAGIGAALVAPRTTAPNWSRTRRTLSTIYAVASLLSLVSNIVQMGITAALASPTYGLYTRMQQVFDFATPVPLSVIIFAVISAVSMGGIIVAALVNAMGDIGATLYAISLARVSI